MEQNLIFLLLIFITIIIISILYNTLEGFNSPDSILVLIRTLQNAYTALGNASVKNTTDVLMPDGKSAKASTIIDEVQKKLTELIQSYELMSRDSKYTPEIIKSTIEEKLNKLIDIHNLINNKLNLKLKDLETIKENLPIKQTIIPNTVLSTAINETLADPVIIAIQSVQNAFIGMKTAVINAGIMTIDTPKGLVSVDSLIAENIDKLNKLTSNYKKYIQDGTANDQLTIKKDVQKNLNAHIEIFNFINNSLHLFLNKIQPNMIQIPHELNDIKKTFEQETPKTNTDLYTQMTTNATIPPPILLDKPLHSIRIPPRIKIKPKPFSHTFIYDQLKKIEPDYSLGTQMDTSN